jgi:hypothetical protein
MNKLKLDLDQLTVESFDTDASGIARRGTVRAHSVFCGPTEVCIPTQGELTCGNTCETCNGTCPDTCAASCGGGCTAGNTCFGTCGASCFDPTCNTCFTRCDQESCGVYICP